MAAQGAAGGRPARHPGEILSKNRTFRCRDRLDEMLQESAAHAGRTVSSEIERRLEESYFRERTEAEFLGSELSGEILRLIRLAMVNEGGVGDWGRDRARAENVRVAANAIIAVICRLPLDLPPPEMKTAGLEEARHLLLKSTFRSRLTRRILAELWPRREGGNLGDPTAGSGEAPVASSGDADDGC
jgi:hypothetical protein